jgi:uncharacterized glyoxalase superfamily protein PhnB
MSALGQFQVSVNTRLLLARASSPEQESRVGAQTGGRVFLFLYTDDFWRDYESYCNRGVEFVRPPKEESYGTVAVFRDLYGNLWDLLQPKEHVALILNAALGPTAQRKR